LPVDEDFSKFGGMSEPLAGGKPIKALCICNNGE